MRDRHYKGTFGRREGAILSVKALFLAVACVALASGSELLAAPAAKVLVKDSGFYRVSKAALASTLGIAETNVASTSFVVSNMGREVTAIRDNGDIIFYGHRFESIYTDQNVYWINPGQPETVPSVVVQAGTSPFAPSFTAVRRSEQNLLIRADLINNTQQGYSDPIFWRMLTSGLSTRFFNAPLALTNVAPGNTSVLKLKLQGATDTAGRFFHRARIDVNGQTQGFLDFEGLKAVEATFPLPAGLLTNGNNIVRIESTPPTGTSFDSFYLDYVEATYQQTFAVQSNRLNMAAVSGSIEVTGLTGADVLLWDVTDLWDANPLSGFKTEQAGSSWKVQFRAPAAGNYAVGRLGAELAPAGVLAASGLDLRAAGWELDHLTIAAPSLVSASQVFASHRQAQGMLASVISVDDVYDAFNHGIRDAQAIQNFLSYAYRNWKRSPRYVLLVGDGSLDYKNRLGFNDCQIPAFPAISTSGMHASDYRFGDPNGNGILAMAVGRVPVTLPEEVSAYAVKMINYEAGGSWRNNSLVSADINDYAGDFVGIANDLQQRISERSIVRADVGELGPEQAREELISSINEGKEMSVYVGHGTPNALSLQSVLMTSDLPLFTNSNSPTAFVLIGCLVGSFGNPGVTNIGEGMVRAKGGVVSLVAASTLISAVDGQVLAERLLDSVYSEGKARLGDAWIDGKNQLTEVGRNPAFRGFQLHGDPALAIGASSAPRPMDGVGPSRPSPEEWQSWFFPPSLEQVGEIYNPEGDEDGDGVSNDGEYLAGTSPVDPQSLLRIVNVRRLSANKVQVSWPSAIQRLYKIETSTSIRGPFTELVDNLPSSYPANLNTYDVTDDAFVPRFFRVIAR